MVCWVPVWDGCEVVRRYLVYRISYEHVSSRFHVLQQQAVHSSSLPMKQSNKSVDNWAAEFVIPDV